MSEQPTVVVFGPSGIGKSTACVSFASRHPEFQYIRASKVLAELSDAAQPNGSARPAPTRDQLRLAYEIAKRRSPEAPALIDAHSIVGNEGEVAEVPTSAICALKPTLLVYLQLPPDELLYRRRTANPPRPYASLSAVALEQSHGLEVVERYSRELDLPLKVATASSPDVLEALIFPGG